MSEKAEKCEKCEIGTKGAKVDFNSAQRCEKNNYKIKYEKKSQIYVAKYKE